MGLKKSPVFSAVLAMLMIGTSFLSVSARAQAQDVVMTDEDPESVVADLEAQGIALENDQPLKMRPHLNLGTPAMSVEIDVYKPEAKAGLDKEFVIVVVNGEIKHAFVTSTATNQIIGGSHKFTPEFQNVKLTVPKVHGIPYPWTTSSTYGNSPMFWGLQIHGGYFIHSTPHYAELGQPASMGCARIDFPSAMELWDLVVDQANGDATINVFGAATGARGRDLLQQHLKDSNLTLSDIQKSVNADLDDAHAVAKVIYNGRGHKRMDDQSITWPTCGGKDCFAAFGVKKPLN